MQEPKSVRVEVHLINGDILTYKDRRWHEIMDYFVDENVQNPANGRDGYKLFENTLVNSELGIERDSHNQENLRYINTNQIVEVREVKSF